MRISSMFPLMIAAILAVVLSHPNPADAKATPLPGRGAGKSTEVGSRLPDDNMDRIDALEPRVDAAEKEIEKLKRMRRQIIDACADLPSDVTCDAELREAKRDLTLKITNLTTIVTRVERATNINRANIAQLRVDLNTAITNGRTARTELEARVNRKIKAINARWRPGFTAGLEFNQLVPARIHEDVTASYGVGVHGGVVVERSDVGVAGKVYWSSLSPTSDLQGNVFGGAAYGYWRDALDIESLSLGGGLDFHYGLMHDSAEDLGRYQFSGISPQFYIGYQWSLDHDVRIRVSGTIGPAIHQVYLHSLDQGTAFNGAMTGLEATAIFGGRD